jgi:kynurenine formamidase
MTRSIESQKKQRVLVDKWHAEHPERVAAIKTRWAERNREKARQAHRDWKARNPAAVLSATRQRQAKRRAAQCDCCQSADAKVNFEVAYDIARRLRMHVDHVRPLSKGGKHCLHNLQYLTPLDNMRKSAKWQEAA